MKGVVFSFLIVSLLHSQAQLAETAPAVEESAPMVIRASLETSPPLILGRLAGEPVLTPPLPAPVLPPRLVIPEQNTLASKTYQAGDHTVTVQDVLPVELPPRPSPPPTLSDAQKRALLATRLPLPKRQVICLSSTVYDHRATRISWRDATGKRVFEAWSNVDFEALRGVSNIRQGDSVRTYFHFGIGAVDTEKMAAHYARFNKIYQKPEIPELPANPDSDPAFVVTKGDPGPEDLEKIRILHDLYKAEHVRLKAAAEFTRQQNALRAAELAANPPKAPDIVVKRWSLSNQRAIGDLTDKVPVPQPEATAAPLETGTEGGVQ